MTLLLVFVTLLLLSLVGLAQLLRTDGYFVNSPPRSRRRADQLPDHPYSQ